MPATKASVVMRIGRSRFPEPSALHSATPKLVRVIDEDAVLLHDSEQDQEPEHRLHVELKFEQGERHEREREGER